MPAIDAHGQTSEGLTGPADDAEAITPHDVNELQHITRALYVGGAGAVVVVMRNGAQVTLSGVGAGTLLPIRIKQVRATGTTASGLVGLY